MYEAHHMSQKCTIVCTSQLAGKANIILLQVRPSYAETSLRQVPFGASGRDHLLKAYRNSLMSVLLNQFDRSKRFQDGMQASSSRVGIYTGICSISSCRLSRLVTA